MVRGWRKNGGMRHVEATGARCEEACRAVECVDRRNWVAVMRVDRLKGVPEVEG